MVGLVLDPNIGKQSGTCIAAVRRIGKKKTGFSAITKVSELLMGTSKGFKR